MLFFYVYIILYNIYIIILYYVMLYYIILYIYMWTLWNNECPCRFTVLVLSGVSVRCILSTNDIFQRLKTDRLPRCHRVTVTSIAMHWSEALCVVDSSTVAVRWSKALSSVPYFLQAVAVSPPPLLTKEQNQKAFFGSNGYVWKWGIPPIIAI
jgi:hypothetical protein